MTDVSSRNLSVCSVECYMYVDPNKCDGKFPIGWKIQTELLALSEDCINWIDCLAKPNATSNSRWAAQQFFHCCRNGFFGSQCASPERLVSTDTDPTSCTYLFPLSWDRGSQWPPAGFQRRGLWFRFQYLISFHVSRLHLSTSSWTGAQHSSLQCIH